MRKIIAKVQFNEKHAFVLSKEPKLLYTKYDVGSTHILIGVDKSKTFYNSLYCYRTKEKAFAGRTLHIPMADGSETIAQGEYWHGGFTLVEDILGIKTARITANDIESLIHCYVFTGYLVDVAKWDRLKKPEKVYGYAEYEKYCRNLNLKRKAAKI